MKLPIPALAPMLPFLLTACASTPDADAPEVRPEVRYYMIADT